MRKLCELIILLTSLFHHRPAHAQVATLTGNVNNINTVGQAGGIRVMQVIYELHSLSAGGVDQLGCGPGILPRVTGSGVALATTQWPFTPSGIGAMSGSIYRNDFIDCAGVTPTFYKVYMVYAGSKSLFGAFKIDSTTVVSGNFNFTTAAGLTSASFTAPVGTTLGAVLITPAGDQTITVGSLFMPSAKALGWTDGAFSRIGVGIVGLGNGTPSNTTGTFVAGTLVAQSGGLNTASMNSGGVGASSATVIGFSSTTDANASRDTGMSRCGAATLCFGNGTAGNSTATLQAGKFIAVGATANFTAAATGVATSGANFGSNSLIFSASSWNGSAAQTDNWTFQAGENSGTNPTSFLFIGGPSRTQTWQYVLSASAIATSGLNVNAPDVMLRGNYWNGSAGTIDDWHLDGSLGTGTNPTTTLAITHAGSTGVAAVFIPNLQIASLGSATTPSITWTGNGLTNWGLNQDFGTGLIVTVENGLNTATLGHQIKFQSTGDVGWTSSNNATASEDTVLYRESAGVVAAGTTLHNAAGTLKAANFISTGSVSGIGFIFSAGCTATVSTNCPSDEEQFKANYWDGSASQTSVFHLFDWAIGTGANPTMRLALTHTQTGGTGLATELDLGPTRLASNLVTPASSAAACVTGQTWDDANFVYVCTATNTIKRATLATF